MTWNPILAAVVRGFSRLHAAVYRLAGGAGLVGRNTLLLTTRGRKTGRELSIPLLYVAEGERLYVVASFGGSDRPPHWYLNLKAHPEVGAQVGGAMRRYRARSLTTEQAAAVWPKLLAMYPTYADYQTRTSRVIPVVELAPVGG